MNQIFPSCLFARPLRESSLVAWIHATGICGLGGDKAGFYAMGAI